MPPTAEFKEITRDHESRLDDGERIMKELSDQIAALRSSLWKIFGVCFALSGFWATFVYRTVSSIETSTSQLNQGVQELQITSAEMRRDLKYHDRFKDDLRKLEDEIDQLKEHLQ